MNGTTRKINFFLKCTKKQLKPLKMIEVLPKCSNLTAKEMQYNSERASGRPIPAFN
jgi:hypothetical protein